MEREKVPTTNASMQPAATATKPASRTRSIAFVGLSIALIAVSAWIVVPLGPIPFTLQMLSIPFIIYLLRPAEAIAAVYGWVVLGAIGVPVFSGMRGGIGVILGPTGGFIDGYLIGVPVAVAFLYLVRRTQARTRGKAQSVPTIGNAEAEASEAVASYRTYRASLLSLIRNCGWGVVAGLIFVLFAYTVGVIQYTFVAHVGVDVALAACVFPFIVPDILKVALGVACAQAVASALDLGDHA